MSKKKSRRPLNPQYNPSRLRSWRDRADLTQEELAEKAKTTGATISRLENGLQPYSQPLFERLAAALRCKPSDLIDRRPGAAETVGEIFAGLPEDAQSYALTMLKALRDRETRS